MTTDPQTQRNRDMIDTLMEMPIKLAATLPKEAKANYLAAIQAERDKLDLLDAMLDRHPDLPF
jgi:hypothetical protein